MENDEIINSEVELTPEEKLNDALERIDILEERLNSSQLFSERFQDRALAVFGHTIIMYLFFVIIIYGAGVLLGIFGKLGGLFK
jgi:hypothetical protein